jgi:hypothetical protein
MLDTLASPLVWSCIFPFGSPVQAQGSFAHSFGESGVYRYYCKPHVSLGMKGVVVVEDD